MKQRPVLVSGTSGQAGQRFVALVLKKVHTVRAQVRTRASLTLHHPDLDVRQEDLGEVANLEALRSGTGTVIAMLGKVTVQRTMNTASVGVVRRRIEPGPGAVRKRAPPCHQTGAAFLFRATRTGVALSDEGMRVLGAPRRL